MALTSDLLDAMLAADLTREQIVALVKAHVAADELKAEDRRAKDAERQRRNRHAVSDGVRVTPRDTVDNAETPPPLMVPLDKEKSPTPPKEINPPLNPPTDGKRARATRLPSDWRPPPDWIGDAVGLGFSEDEARHEADRFRDFWVAKAGKDACKLDWRATWRNWCRNALERRPKPSGPNVRSGGGYGRFADPVEIRNRLVREHEEANDVSAGRRLLRGSGVG